MQTLLSVVCIVIGVVFIVIVTIGINEKRHMDKVEKAENERIETLAKEKKMLKEELKV